MVQITMMNTRITSAKRVTWVGFYVNLVLTSFKLAAGIIGHSGAMVADAIHSLSDFATDIVVLVAFRLVGKPADRSHDYGHGKYETLATAIIGGALLLVGAGIFWSAAVKIWGSVTGRHVEAPGFIAFVAAVVSILVKEWLYRYTAKVGKHINSQAVIANAWHHRSDAFSSIGTMLGIGGAIILGEKWHVLDPLAAIVVSFFIVKIALEISSGSIRELTEESLDEATETEILQMASSTAGVVSPHNLRTRRIGSDVAVDLHIRIDADMCVSDAHTIASKVEERIRARFGQSAFVSIHIEPVLRDAMQARDEKKKDANNHISAES
jgi:cation diffusion facilitator family transporter